MISPVTVVQGDDGRYYINATGVDVFRGPWVTRSAAEEAAKIARAKLRGSTHTHRPKVTDVKPFNGPVSDRQTPAAHGGVCVVDVCRCGAVRKTNVNQWYRERGKWTPQEN